ncbi:uncharacterized protein VTP21DRAFT_7520 [Calcarisporiella thermophila]|uniref:uncharacterized protein n=1 Tax=Calcarisporiella thermophila TaxID=911321 RepID=UPI003742BB23
MPAISNTLPLSTGHSSSDLSPLLAANTRTNNAFGHFEQSRSSKPFFLLAPGVVDTTMALFVNPPNRRLRDTSVKHHNWILHPRLA